MSDKLYVETVGELIALLNSYPPDMGVSNDYGEDLQVEIVGNCLEFR